MVAAKILKELAKEHGTPLFVVDHSELRKNLMQFNKYLPRVQPYYAVKSNPDPEIIRTLFNAGAAFDVASIREFKEVYSNLKGKSNKEKSDYVWNKIIYAHPIKSEETLRELNKYEPLVTYDNSEEVKKIKKFAPDAGLVLRVKVPNTGSVVELSSKFGADSGEAVELIKQSFDAGMKVEGLSFHVGSQCTNFENYVQALNLCAGIFEEAELAGYELTLLDIGGGFPAPYNEDVEPFKLLARKLNAELKRLFPKKVEIIAEPGRFMVATSGTIVSKIIGKAERDGKKCYYINDGVYHTYNGIIYDHCTYPVKSFKKGEKEVCAVFGQTCDALDTIGLSEFLPDLNINDFVYSENIGAYSAAASTWFNGFPPAKIVHINQK